MPWSRLKSFPLPAPASYPSRGLRPAPSISCCPRPPSPRPARRPAPAPLARAQELNRVAAVKAAMNEEQVHRKAMAQLPGRAGFVLLGTHPVPEAVLHGKSLRMLQQQDDDRQRPAPAASSAVDMVLAGAPLCSAEHPSVQESLQELLGSWGISSCHSDTTTAATTTTTTPLEPAAAAAAERLSLSSTLSLGVSRWVGVQGVLGRPTSSQTSPVATLASPQSRQQPCGQRRLRTRPRTHSPGAQHRDASL